MYVNAVVLEDTNEYKSKLADMKKLTSNAARWQYNSVSSRITGLACSIFDISH